jgi:hypothetical protein
MTVTYAEWSPRYSPPHLTKIMGCGIVNVDTPPKPGKNFLLPTLNSDQVTFGLTLVTTPQPTVKQNGPHDRGLEHGYRFMTRSRPS